MYSQMSCK